MDAGLTSARKATTIYWILAAELRAALGRRLAGSISGPPHFMRCRSGLGLGFFVSLVSLHEVLLACDDKGNRKAFCVLMWYSRIRIFFMI